MDCVPERVTDCPKNTSTAPPSVLFGPRRNRRDPSGSALPLWSLGHDLQPKAVVATKERPEPWLHNSMVFERRTKHDPKTGTPKSGGKTVKEQLVITKLSP